MKLAFRFGYIEAQGNWGFWGSETMYDVMRRSREGTGGPDPPLENHKAIGFFINTGLYPLENHKATNLAFNIVPLSARQRIAIKWHYAGWPMMACFSGVWILFPLINWQNFLDPCMGIEHFFFILLSMMLQLGVYYII